MNPVEYTRKGGDKVAFWGCGECRRIYETQEVAESCCKPYVCKTCGAETPRYWLICNQCRAIKGAEKLKREVEKAKEKISWREVRGEYIFVPQLEELGYLPDLDMVCDAVMDSLRPGETFAAYFDTKPVYPSLDAGQIIDHLLDGCPDGCEDMFDGKPVRELQKVLDEWCKGREPMWWVADYDRAIVDITPEEVWGEDWKREFEIDE